jgi:hypothetical protein
MLAARANIRPLSSRNLLRQLYSNSVCIRRVSTARLDPAIRAFAAALAEKQPCFSMSPKDVHVLSEPKQFHERLLVSCYCVCLAGGTLFAQRPRFRTWFVALGDEYSYRLYILAMPTSSWSVPHFLATSYGTFLRRASPDRST